MNILLVNPAFPPSLWDFQRARDLEDAYPHPPLSLPTLAALTPRQHQVTLVDENVEPTDLGQPCDLVGITGYYIQRHRVFALADAFRARGCRVAIGGPIVEASTRDECARHADHVFQGEAEYTWPRFLDELAAGRAQPLYVQSELVDMHDSPPPRYELLRRGAYSSATIETSRGCPMACEFCEIPSRLGQRARSKTVEQVMAEVRHHHALGADSIFFIDDHFIGNRGHTKRLLEELVKFVREIDYRMYFTCQFTINLARDEEMLALLEAAHFRRVFVGIETPRKASLLSARKKQNVVGDLVANVHALQARGITVWAGMIVGFDTDDEQVFDEQCEFLQDAGIPVVMSGLLQAIPGTPLHARMAAEGRLREAEMSGVRGTYDALIASNIVPVGMSDEALVSGYQRMVRAVYEPEAFGERVLTSIARSQRAPAKKSGLPSLRNLWVLGRLVRHYLWRADARQRRMFLRVVSATRRLPAPALETALMHLVVYKHLHEFYREVAALPVPVTAARASAASAAG